MTLHSSRMNGETLAIRDEQNNVLNVNNKVSMIMSGFFVGSARVQLLTKVERNETRHGA